MARKDGAPLAPPGSRCESDLRRVTHVVQDPEDDEDLQTVHRWLRAKPIEQLLTGAVNDAVEYVLDGARTWRFDLQSPDVDSDERRTVGTKLQYRIIAALDLTKAPPLDTVIEGIAVELKGTVRGNWMIPREGQCQICLLVQVDARNDQHRAFLMRTHRLWLNLGNQDSKRTIRGDALEAYALRLIPWTPLPRNPLKDLTEEQRAVVFSPKDGQVVRLTAMFGYLRNVVVPRTAILTVCANRADPMRRVRQLREEVLRQHGLRLLCGTWPDQRAEAEKNGFDLSGEAWVAYAARGPGLSPTDQGADPPAVVDAPPAGDTVPDGASAGDFLGSDPPAVVDVAPAGDTAPDGASAGGTPDASGEQLSMF